MIRIGLSGCLGTMGQIISDLIEQQDGVELVFGIDKRAGEIDVLYPVFSLPKEVNLSCDVIIDFSNAGNVDDLIDYCISNQVAAVIATTGLSEKQEEKIKEAARIIPIFRSANTSLGINVLLDLVKKATSILSDNFDIEIIEKHHNKKVDAPSGTAIKTAELISEKREKIQQGAADEEELIPGARGAEFEGMRIHSVRLPGLVAHQEVIFGSQGEGLTLRHDSYDRVSFMTGVNLGIKEVVKRHELVYGLEHLL